MAKPHNIKDNASRVHDTFLPISDDECARLVKEYGFTCESFCAILNHTLSWIDIYLEKEPQSLSTYIARLKETKSKAKSLGNQLAKEKEEYFYRNLPPIDYFHEIKTALGGVRSYGRGDKKHPSWSGLILQCEFAKPRRERLRALRKDKRTLSRWRKLVAEWKAKEAKWEALDKQAGHEPTRTRSPDEELEYLKAMNLPPKALTRHVENAAIGLYEVLDRLGNDEIKNLLDHGEGLPKGEKLPIVLEWLADVSGKAVDDWEAIPYQEDGWVTAEKKKPETFIKQRLLHNLYEYFMFCNPARPDKIQWDCKARRYTGGFFEFAKDVFSILRKKGEPYSKVAKISDLTLAKMINNIPNKNEK